MAYWLMKSEPEVFSAHHLREQREAGWDGVRNYQARNFMRAMRRGDQAFFYHSNAKPSGVAGIMEVVQEAYPDEAQFDPKNDYYDPASPRKAPRWDKVDVRFVRMLPRFISLEEIRNTPALQNMMLLKRSRLSVQPVTEREWRTILELAQRT